MNLSIVFSDRFSKYQLYRSIPNADWELLSVNINIAKGKVYFDLLLYSKENNKLVPIILNTLTEDFKIEIPTILRSLSGETINYLYAKAFNIISQNLPNMKTVNSVFFTDSARDLEIFKSKINPHRRPMIGIGIYANILRPILYYQAITNLIQNNVSKDKKEINILDCSCGVGYGSLILGNLENSRVLGADIDEDAIVIANMINLDKENVSFKASSMEELRTEGLRFDCVVTLETIEHVEDPDLFIRSAINLLDKEGLLIVSFPYWRFHGSDLNSDHRTNWSIEKVEKFLKKYLNHFNLAFIELIDNNDDMLNALSNFSPLDYLKSRERIMDERIENIYSFAKREEIKEETSFYFQSLQENIDKRLRIMFVNHSVPPYEYTGTPICTYSQMKNLKKLGHETAVIIPHPEAVREAIKEVVDGNLIYKVPPLNWGEVFLEDAFLGYNFRWYLDLIEDVLDDFKPDVIHINDYVSMSAEIIELFEAKGIPVVREVHNMEELCYKIGLFDRDGLCSGPESPEKCAKCVLKETYDTNAIFRLRNEAVYLSKFYARFKYMEYLYNRFNKIIFSVLSWQNYFSKFISLPKDKTHIIPIGVSLPISRRCNIKKTSETVKFAYIGNIAGYKGFDVLEEVFSSEEILKEEFKLFIYGKIFGPAVQEKLLELERKSGGKVIYKGSYKREELPKILEEIDIGIVPYYFETYSIVTREFLYLGIPVIASNTYGIIDVIKDGYNGLLFDVGNSKQLKEKVMMVLDNRELIDNLKKGAISTPIPTLEDEAKALEKIYSELVIPSQYNNVQVDLHPSYLDVDLKMVETKDSKVSIVIVTYNSSSTIENCLNSIISNTTDVPYEVIIVDNDSKDDTVALSKRILSQTDVPYKIIENKENIGYSAGANQGVRASSGEFIVFLNPNTVLYKNWLSGMLKYFQIENVGAVGPVSDYVAGYQKAQFYIDGLDASNSLEAFSKAIYNKNNGKAVETKLLIGFCLLTKREVIEKVGTFDENLFLEQGDLDFSWRLRINGYKLLIATDIFIHHEGQVSFKSEVSDKTRLLVQESADYLYSKLRKYYGDKVPTPIELWNISWFSPSSSLTSIVILTLNNLEYTKQCIESIRRYTPEPYEIIVVDNGSKDGTIEYLESQPDIRLIKNPTNLGFALGNNIGMKEARGDYIVVLNNDTIVTQGWLTRLIACAESDPSNGIIGPRSNYVAGIQIVKDVSYGNDMNAMQEFARRWSLENSGKYEETIRVIGFCMLIKREVIEKIGGFDPLYESGNFEDDDFCIRAIRAGFKIKIAHDVFIHHYGSKTFASEKINYTESMLKNWERFKEKWDIPPSWTIDKGIPILDLVKGGFDKDKFYVPLDIAPIKIEGMRSKNFLGRLNLATMKWFLSNYRVEDDVALVLYEENPDSSYEKLLELIEKLGYKPEYVPDIIIYSDKLSRFEEPRLISSIDGIIDTTQIDKEWLEWARRLGKEIIEA